MIINNIYKLINENTYIEEFSFEDMINKANDSLNKANETLNSFKQAIDDPQGHVRSKIGEMLNFGKTNLSELTKNDAFLKWVTKDKPIGSIKSGKDILDAISKAGNKLEKFENLFLEAPDSLKRMIANFFLRFGNNDIVYKLIDISNGNPYVYVAIIMAVPAAILTLLSQGGIYLFKKLKEYQASKQELDVLSSKLISAKSIEDKKKIADEIAKVDTQQLVHLYLTKK